MGGVRAPGQTSDQWLYLEGDAVDLTGTAADVKVFVAPVAGHIIAWGYQVTTTIAADTTAPVISLDVSDYDDSSNRSQLDAVTLADGTAAANAPTIRLLSGSASSPTAGTTGGQGIAVTAGQHIVLEHKTKAVDGSSAAGAARVFVCFRPAE